MNADIRLAKLLGSAGDLLLHAAIVAITDPTALIRASDTKAPKGRDTGSLSHIDVARLIKAQRRRERRSK